MKPIYVNAAAAFSDELDLKALIPDANMRRRMSRIVRMGVAAGQECLRRSEVRPDAIVSATGYGCLADSEKFLRTIIAQHEEQLTPTPFIQSTFNTIGGCLAIMNGLDCYNNTFVNRFQSFADALLDAALNIASGSRNVLVVAADELTPSLAQILRRLGAERTGNVLAECAFAFILSHEKTDASLLEISSLALATNHHEHTLRNTPCPVSPASEVYRFCTQEAAAPAEWHCQGIVAHLRKP